MKIALYNLTTTTKSGGIETFNLEMAKTLARRGYTVHIYGGKGRFAHNMPESVTVFQYPFIRREIIPNFGTRFRKFMERLSFGVLTLKDLIKRRYDYIYVSKPFDIPIALISSAFSKTQLIFGSQGTEFFPGYKTLVKKVNYFFSCSEFNANQIEQYCMIRPRVLHNGVNTDLFKPLSPDSDLHGELKLSDSEKVLISAGRLIGWKGFRYSIKAVAGLISKGYSIKYLIIGDGEDKENLQALAANLKIEGRVLFLGNVDNYELPKYYSIADIAVYPSVADETFGISIAEAISCGIPVVSTNVGGIPEVVSKSAGLLVPPRNEDALLKALETLISDEALRKEIKSNGRKWIYDNFRWDVVLDKLERYIKHD